jgi:Flp pilus assembly protein TadG
MQFALKARANKARGPVGPLESDADGCFAKRATARRRLLRRAFNIKPHLRDSALRALARDERGATFIIVTAAMVMLVGAVGVAVDVGRAQMTQTKLQNALDAAGLAAGASVNSTDLETEVLKYVTLNFHEGIQDAVITNVTPVLSNDGTLLTVTATATMPTTFMRIFGENEVTMSARTEVTRANKGMELALVLDVTGSMAGSKLTALKDASYDLIGILFGDGNNTGDNLWIGVVPFSQAVNVGNAHTDWLNAAQFGALNWGTTSWAGCVEARWQNGRDITDDPPSTEALRAYYWADHNTHNNWIRNDGTFNISSSRGPNLNCPAPLIRLTGDRGVIEDGIDALAAVGATHVNVGAAWGWRLLSPRWRGLWGGGMDSNALPLDYNTDRMIKAIVIMTDGENTMYNEYDTAYGYLSDGQLGTTNQNNARIALNNKLASICSAMKQNGIIIYTVVFDLNSASVETLMRNCASQPDYFFDSPDEETLQQAFRTIGDSLANLRISR